MQGELFCRCLETDGQRCVRCDWTLELVQKMAGRRAAWVRNVNAYMHPELQLGTGRRSFELRRGDARFEVVRDARTGSVEAFAIGPGGLRTPVGPARVVFAAGAEAFPCNVSYVRRAG